MARFRRSGVNWEGRPWTLAPSLVALAGQVEGVHPEPHPTDGTVASRNHDANNPNSDHRPHPFDGPGVVRAIDIGETAENDAFEIAEAIRVSRDPRIRYVIHEARLFSSYPKDLIPPYTWRPYSLAPHLDHVHISTWAESDDNTDPWTIMEDDMPLSDDDIARIWAHLIPVTSPAGATRTAEVILESLRNDAHRIIRLIDALDIEGISEDELDERVDRLLAVLPDRTVDRIRDRLT